MDIKTEDELIKSIESNHAGVQSMFKENYEFEVKHRHLKYVCRTVAENYRKKAKKDSNKIKRLKKEIEELEESFEYHDTQYQNRLNELNVATEYEEYFREKFEL